VPPFIQMVEPLGSVLAGTLVAMIPVAVLLVLLAGSGCPPGRP
jgi:ABC-type glycerol-3-phosphate transport system permease component